jgi:hypothetical protein
MTIPVWSRQVALQARLVHSRLRQAEAVSRSLGVPVLIHATKKPGCLAAVQQHFAGRIQSSEPFKILVVGDRPLTDIVLGHRLSSLSSIYALPILTTHLWKQDRLLSRLLRVLESAIVRLVSRSVSSPPFEAWMECIVRAPPKPPGVPRRALSLTSRVLGWTARATWTQLKRLVQHLRS